MTFVYQKDKREVKKGLEKKRDKKFRDAKINAGFQPTLNLDLLQRQSAGLTPAQIKSGARRVA